MRQLSAIVVALIAWLASPSIGARQADRPVPFTVGETLTYDIGWSGILTAGTATTTVMERRQVDARTAVYDIVAEGRPVSFLEKLYRVYYKAETLLNTSTLKPSMATIYSDERGRKKLKTTRFLTPTSLDFQPKTEAPREKRTVPNGTVDPLAAVYLMRLMPLEAGRPVTMSVIEDSSLYTVRWSVTAPAALTTPLGTSQAWQLTPVLTDAAGKPVADRKIVIWMSDDARRLPLKYQVGLAVGNFTLTLARVSG